MEGRPPRGALLVGVLAAPITGHVLLACDERDPGSPGPAVAERTRASATRETGEGGLVARLPFVGTLTWRCDDQRRFSTRLVLPRPGATVFVSVSSDGARVWRRRRVDPAPAPARTVIGPFPALRRQAWTIRYQHKPATVAVAARLRFAAPPARSQCIVSRAWIEVRRTPH